MNLTTMVTSMAPIQMKSVHMSEKYLITLFLNSLLKILPILGCRKNHRSRWFDRAVGLRFEVQESLRLCQSDSFG